MNTSPLVLIIDDESSIVEMMSIVLTDEGYRVATANNGEEALEWLSSNQPDMILLDLLMPIMDGATFWENLSKQVVRPPVILVAAHPRIDEIAGELRFDGYLRKPFEIADLLSLVEQNLEDRSGNEKSPPIN